MGDTDGNGSPKDLENKVKHWLLMEKRDLLPAGKVQPTWVSCVNQMRPESVNTDSGKTAVLSKDGAGSKDKSEPQV